MDAHRDCPKCAGKVRLWYKGEEVLRVTGRKDTYGEVQDWICNECRFDKKKTSDWTIEGPSKIASDSVISANHYESLKALKTTIDRQRKGLPHGVKVPAGQGALDPNNTH
jgi:NADH-quinone oxidoreductase subunit G